MVSTLPRWRHNIIHVVFIQYNAVLIQETCTCQLKLEFWFRTSEINASITFSSKALQL